MVLRFLFKTDFCLCWRFAASVIAQINKVHGLVNAQIKLVYANKQVRLVRHASIGGALMSLLLAGSTHDGFSKDKVSSSH